MGNVCENMKCGSVCSPASAKFLKEEQMQEIHVVLESVDDQTSTQASDMNYRIRHLDQRNGGRKKICKWKSKLMDENNRKSEKIAIYL